MADVELKISAETQEALDSIQSFSTKSIMAFKAFGAAAVAYLGGKAIIGAVESFVDAALESEEAVNNLNISLASAGTFSEQASKGMQDYATSMQATTGISDELILNQIAIARNFTKTNEQAQKLTAAAIQLSAATGKDLNTSVEMLGKSMEGVATGINKTLPATKGFTEAQLKAGAAVDFVLQRFGGVAEAKFQSFGGAITGTKNAFGDMLEVLGDLIIKNPIVISLVQGLGKVFLYFGEVIKKNQGFLGELITKGLKVFAAAIPKIIAAVNFLLKTFGSLIFVVGKLLDGVLFLVEAFLHLKTVRFVINLVKDGLVAIGISVANVVDGFLFLISKLPGADSAFKKLGVNIDEARGAVDKLRDGLIDNMGKDFSDDAIDGFNKFRDAAKITASTIVDGIGDVSEVLTDVGKITEDNSAKIQEMGAVQEDSSKKAIQALNANAKQIRNLRNELEELKKKAEEAFKKPFDFIVKTVVEKTSAVNEKFRKSLEEVQTWVADHPIEIQTAASVAGVLNSIFKSGAGSSKILEEELLRAIGSVQAELDAAIGEINKQRDEAVIEIENDFSGSLAGLQKELEQGSITQVEYQSKINDLEEKRASDIKAENKKAADRIREERVKSEKEIAKLREDHQKKLNELQEKNIQAAAKVVGEMANAVAQAAGLPPIFGEIINMLAAPPEVWISIIDGLVEGIPLLVTRIVENIPIITAKLAEAMPEVAVGFMEALINVLTDPKFYERIVAAQIKASEKTVQIFGRAMLDGVNNFIRGAVQFGQIIGGVGQWFADKIKEVFNKIGNFGGAAGTGGFENAIGIDIPGVRWATGGVVPSGFPNDTFRANLTSGEMVIPSNDVQRLSRFLDNQEAQASSVDIVSQLKQLSGNQNQSITINLQVGEKELAQVMLDLNRRGFRTA